MILSNILIYDDNCSFCRFFAKLTKKMLNGDVSILPNTIKFYKSLHPSLTARLIKKDVHIIYEGELFSGGGVLACILASKIQKYTPISLYRHNVVFRSILNSAYFIAKKTRKYLSPIFSWIEKLQ